MIKLWKRYLVRLSIVALISVALVFMVARLMEILRASDMSQESFYLASAGIVFLSMVILGLSFRFFVSKAYDELQDRRSGKSG